MKLIAANYISPLLTQGEFKDVTVQDVSLTHNRQENYLALTFEMAYMRDSQKIVLDTVTMGFQGMESDQVSTNRTTTMSIPNPDHDPALEGSAPRVTVGLFDYLKNNKGQLPNDYSIVDYGYPTYEKVKEYFEGGTLENPEITITEPLAIGFLLTNLIINGEPVGNQFQIV